MELSPRYTLNVHKFFRYRENLKKNQDVWQAYLEKERTRKKLSRLKPKSEEQILKEKEQNRIQQVNFRKRREYMLIEKYKQINTDKE